jgi:uncharacterized protein (TIGR02646 family)
MRTINKPEQVPQKLIDVQNNIAEDLYTKKEKFKWRTEHYSAPIKSDLKDIYHNKCAFCEVELTEQDTENKFTVEHYRPKSIYYWLGAEWTNLFPACCACNHKKGNEFPLFLGKNKIKSAPFDDINHSLIKDRCKANSDELLNEEPLYLHPEITTPEKYFQFEAKKQGAATILNEDSLSPLEQEQARKMLKLINRPSVEEKRKRKWTDYQTKLRRIILNGREELGSNYSDYSEKEIKLLFLSFFAEIKENQQSDKEFSLFHCYLIKNFNDFFLPEVKDERDLEIKNLVERAYKLHIKDSDIVLNAQLK